MWSRRSIQVDLHVFRSSSKRHVTTSPRVLSHIGSNPIQIPDSVQLSFPSTSSQPVLSSQGSSSKRSLVIRGPLGIATVNLRPAVILDPPSETEPRLVVRVRDANEKRQKADWGTTRSIIANAIHGVSAGFVVELRLVGVGYRAAIEPIPPNFLALQQRLRPSASLEPSLSPPGLPTQRLNIKLGYSHPVLIDIPPDIAATVPAPTRIVLSGIDKQKLGLFAAQIRRWRKPEPYRGKGIFVGDETIKLKEVRKK